MRHSRAMNHLIYFFKDMLWLFLMFIGFIVIAAFLMVGNTYLQIARGGQKQKFLFLDQYISKRGYHFINPELHDWIMCLSVFEFAKKINSASLKKGSDGLMSMQEFQNGHPAGVEAFALNVQGNETAVFAYTYSGNTGQNGDAQMYTIHLKMAKMSFHAGTRFRIEPKDVAARVKSAVNQILAANHVAGTAQYLQLSEHPDFSKHYYLTANDESEVKKFLSPQKISRLKDKPLSGSIVSEPPYLVYFEHGQFTHEASYDEFVAQAKLAYETLLLT